MASDATVIVPAAGLGKRFSAKGYKTPKPMIRFEYRGKNATMLEHAVNAVAGTKREVLVGVHHSFTREAASIWPVFQLVPIANTLGQADTLLQLLNFVEGPVLIVNSDAGLHVPAAIWGRTGLVLETLCIDVSSLAIKLYEPSPYSHVDDIPLFEGMAEKIWLSPYACAGAWWFYDATELRVLLKVSLGMGPSEDGEYYLSTALNGCYGYAHLLHKHQYHSWNTPEDLESDPDVTDIRKG